MSRRGYYWRAVLVLGWLGSSLLASAQVPPELRHPVRLTPGGRSLGAVLAELSRQSRLPFSYSSSLVPLAHRYQVRPGPARPAGIVLREVLASEHLAYGLLAGQVVLWPDHTPTPPGITMVNGELVREQDVTSARTLPSSIPLQLLLSAKPLGSPVTTRTTSHPSTSQRPNGKFGARLIPLPATLAVGRKAAAGAKRLAIRPHTLAATSTKAASALKAQPGYSARYLPGKHVGRATGQAPLPNVVAPAKTSDAASDKARSLAQLPLKPVDLHLVSQASTLPATLGLPAEVRAGLGAAPTTSPVPNQPLALKPSWKGLYLHGEAWTSESLPIGAMAKVGVARAYLVLGLAVASAGRGVGGTWGVGLGTTGRARGRFTPSLDVMHWFLGHEGDEDTRPAHLTQLRPLLAWQLKRGGHWALLLGPTFNLATAGSHGAQRGGFGHNQWLLVDKDNEQASVRFWPGVQVGLRF